MPVQVLLRRSSPVFFTLSLFVLYLFTMAPGLTWAHTGADGGDLIAAAATGGVAHPSGYPTFLLLARLFQLFPLGAIAYRTNLMSAVFTTLAAALVYDIVTGSPNSPARGRQMAGLIAGSAFGLSTLAWSQALITEVYGLHVFFVALVVWLLVGRFADSPHKSWLDAAIGLSVGLGMGNHLTAIFLLPVALLVGTLNPLSSALGRKDLRASVNWLVLGRRLGWVFCGLFVYASIPWQAASGAPVNWGYATDFKNLWWLVSGALYQNRVFSLPITDLLPRLAAGAGMLLAQFGVVGLLVGFYHLFGNFSSSRLSWVIAWVAVVNLIFSFGYATLDSYVYLLPFFFAFAIWIGFGVGQITTLLAQRKNWISVGVNAMLLTFFLGMAVMNYRSLDLSRDHGAEAFAKQAMVAIPPQAIVLTEGDRAIFSLWYYHFVLKERPDIAVLANGLLPYPWYRDVLRDTYPTLGISLNDSLSWRDSIAQANPARPICDVAIDEQISIVCYSPVSQKSDTPFISIIQPVEK